MIALYDFTLSGNCYKVTDAGTLGLEYKAIPVKLKEGEQGSGISSDIRSARFRFWWITTL